MRTFARRAANTWAGNSREACLGRLRNCCCAVSDSFMKLAQVGSIANKANAADAKSRAADCSVNWEGAHESESCRRADHHDGRRPAIIAATLRFRRAAIGVLSSPDESSA